MRIYYVYLHCRPDGTPFYVGKGHGKRASMFGQRNQHHRSIVSKHGADKIGVFVFPCASEAEAIADERQHIAQLRADGFDLANHTNGGEGVSGLRHSDASRQRMAAAKRGRTIPAATRAKMSAAQKCRAPVFGRKASAETRQRMSSASAGRKRGPLSDKHRANLSAAHIGQEPWNKGLPSPLRGVPRSADVKARLSSALKGRRLSDAHKHKLSAAKMGRPLSAKHRLRVSAALIAFHCQRRAALGAPTGGSDG